MGQYWNMQGKLLYMYRSQEIVSVQARTIIVFILVVRVVFIIAVNTVSTSTVLQ